MLGVVKIIISNCRYNSHLIWFNKFNSNQTLWHGWKFGIIGSSTLEQTRIEIGCMQMRCNSVYALTFYLTANVFQSNSFTQNTVRTDQLYVKLRCRYTKLDN